MAVAFDVAVFRALVDDPALDGVDPAPMTQGWLLVRLGSAGPTPSREKNKLKASLLSPSERPPEREKVEFRYSEQ